MTTVRTCDVVAAVCELDHGVAVRALLPTFLPSYLEEKGIITVHDSLVLGTSKSWM